MRSIMNDAKAHEMILSDGEATLFLSPYSEGLTQIRF